MLEFIFSFLWILNPTTQHCWTVLFEGLFFETTLKLLFKFYSNTLQRKVRKSSMKFFILLNFIQLSSTGAFFKQHIVYNINFLIIMCSSCFYLVKILIFKFQRNYFFYCIHSNFWWNKYWDISVHARKSFRRNCMPLNDIIS